jgi:hypothetical protein
MFQKNHTTGKERTIKREPMPGRKPSPALPELIRRRQAQMQLEVMQAGGLFESAAASGPGPSFVPDDSVYNLVVTFIGLDDKAIKEAMDAVIFLERSQMSTTNQKIRYPDTASKLQELGELFSVKVTIEADKRNAMLVGGKDNVLDVQNKFRELEDLRIDEAIKEPPLLLPDSWQKSTGDSAKRTDAAGVPYLDVFTVAPDSPEFKKVLSQMQATMPTAKIDKLERIQHYPLWEQFCSQKRHLQKKYVAPHPLADKDGDKLIKELFHGTRATNPFLLIEPHDAGFDDRFCESAMWGKGSYFATNASYSNSYGSPVPASNQKQFFLVKVLVGDSFQCPADGTLKMPPLKVGAASAAPLKVGASAAAERFDSVCGVSAGSLNYILYSEKYRAYPSYLITYTT